jgi:hypothetical protein
MRASAVKIKPLKFFYQVIENKIKMYQFHCTVIDNIDNLASTYIIDITDRL